MPPSKRNEVGFARENTSLACQCGRVYDAPTHAKSEQKGREFRALLQTEQIRLVVVVIVVAAVRDRETSATRSLAVARGHHGDRVRQSKGEQCLRLHHHLLSVSDGLSSGSC